MIQIQCRRMFMSALTVVAVSLLSFGTSGCGGGGGGEGASEATVRPKTLDALVLKLGGGVQLEFVRNSVSSGALKDGEEETGAFLYTSKMGAVNFRIYDNIGGSQSNLWWPQEVIGGTYKYRAVNSTSGVLTLKGTGTIQSTYYSVKGQVLNSSAVIPFIRGSFYDYYINGTYYYYYYYDSTNVVEIDLTFSSSGNSVSTNTVTMRLPESRLVGSLDTVRVPSSITLNTGGAVPENYNPEIDPNRPSKVAPPSLHNLLISATNGTDVTKNFTIQFVKDGSYTGPGNSSAGPDEIGTGLLRVAGSPVDVALDYTWRRIGGTDTAQLVLSNIPDDPTLPFDASLNGTYTFSFLGAGTGTYAGIVDGDTASVADVTGTFITLNVSSK